MKRIALIGCSKKKMGKDTPDKKFLAGEIYTGNNFKRSRDFGITFFNCEKEFYILSGKYEYGLLNQNDYISYYDKYLGKVTENEKRKWAEKIISQLRQKFDLSKTEFIIFAGSSYSKYIKKFLNCTILNFNGRTITFDIKEKLFNGGKTNDK